MFGSPRSGSTWLRRMAEQHPLIVGVNEPLIGNHLSPFLSDEPGYRAEDLDLATFTFRRVLEGDPDKFFAEKYADVWVPGLRRLINDRFQAHLEREAGPAAASETLLLIKEPNGSQSADVIMRAQPTARLLFLLRDGRDVVDSEVASFMVGGWQESSFDHMRGLEDSERLDFVDPLGASLALADGGGRGGVRRTSRPEAPGALRGSAARAGAAHARALRLAGGAYGRDRPRQGGRRVLLRAASLSRCQSAEPLREAGRWRENLRPDERDAVQEILAAKVRELGYD